MRFLGTGSCSEFSLSSPDISSLLRFFDRVVLVALAYAGVGFVVLVVGLARSSWDDAGLVEDVLTLLVAALRGLRPKVPVPVLTAFFVVVAAGAVAAVAVAFAGGAGAATG